MRFPSIISKSVIIAAKNTSIHQTNNIVRRFVQSATMKSTAATSMPIQSIHVQPQSQLQQQQKQQFRYATSSGRRGRRRRHRGGEIVEEPQSNNGINDEAGNNSDNSNGMGESNSSIRMVKNKAYFIQASNTFLTKAVTALEPMKAYNDVFDIKRSTNEQGEKLVIGLAPSEGQYTMQVDNKLLTINLLSPMSGNYTYVLSANTNEFVGMHDNHSLEGMLVRDLIRHCHGLPQF